MTWRESRYLPLVLEQADLCDGPVLVHHQDRPWHWTQPGEPPSGHVSAVTGVLEEWKRTVETIPEEPRVVMSVETGGSEMLTRAHCVRTLQALGAEVIIALDSDMLFTLEDMRVIYETIQAATAPHIYGCLAWHYWRDFHHAFGVPTLGLDGSHDRPCEIMLPVTCYHPGYVLTDEEMLFKTSSWAHAQEFKARGFYEKEWMAKNDAAVAPYECPPPPAEIMERLRKAGAL